MSKLAKAATILGFTVILAACGAGRDDDDSDAVFVEPVTVDPVSEKF